MALQTRLVQKLSQQLTITPQLQLAIKLLQMTNIELKEEIDRELNENPLLEIAEEDNISIEEEQHYWEETRYSDSNDDPVSRIKSSATLHEHLVWQVQMASEEIDRQLAFHLIGNLDEYGFISQDTLPEIATTCDTSLEEIFTTLEQLYALEPAGVFAFDAAHALKIQLDLDGLKDSLSYQILDQCPKMLEERDYKKIATTCKVELEDVLAALEKIKAYNPYPALNFGDDDAQVVVPDVYIRRVGDDFVVSLNDDGIPPLAINQDYLKLTKGQSGEADTNKYLTEKYRAASWLLRSIHQRNSTIIKVTNAIVKFQREFLLHGLKVLQPLVLKEIAAEIDMHESTVSRVTGNKYVSTPQGVYPFRVFFSSGLKASGGDISAIAIKEKIKSIIAAEDPDQPISDQAIADIFKKNKIDVARRTVAKYREALKIPSSSQRKRIKIARKKNS